MKVFTKTLLLLQLFCTLLTFNLCAQGQNTDSLYSVWNNTAKDIENRAEAFYLYTWYGYLHTQPDTAFILAETLQNFAQKNNLKPYISKAYSIKAISFDLRGNYAKAMENHVKNLKINEQLNDSTALATTFINMGVLYAKQDNLDKALENYRKALSIDKKLNKKRDEGIDLKNIANIFFRKGKAAFKSKKYQKARQLFQKSIRVNEQGKKIFKTINNKKRTASSINDLGLNYKYLGNLAQQKNQTKKAAKYYEKALRYHRKSLKINQKFDDRYNIASSVIDIAYVLFEQKKYRKSLKYAKKTLKIARAIDNATYIRSAAKILYKNYKKLGQPDQALKKYELYIRTKESLESEKNQRATIRQEYKYEYEKQAQIDSIKNAERQKIAQVKINAQKARIENEKTQRYALYGGLALLLVFGVFMVNRFRVTRRQKSVIENQKDEVETQRDYARQEHNKAEEQRFLVQEKNDEITDSIQYAKRLQSAILPDINEVQKLFPESFIIFQPKDIVSGDFYWMETQGDTTFLAAADCTGHGVPGAMVSVVCANALNKSVNEMKHTNPAEILNETRKLIIDTFSQAEGSVKDGMDISLLSVAHSVRAERESAENPRSHTPTHTVHWAGANNPLWIVPKGAEKIQEIKPDKQPIGTFGEEKPFTAHPISLNVGDRLYMFSDGYMDQFGGEKNKKLKSKNFKKLILKSADQEMSQQKELLETHFEQWKGSLEQLDDVCVVGLRFV